MALHVIVLERRELVHAPVERDRKFAGRIHITQQHLRDGRAAFLPGIPGLEDGVAALGFRHQAYGAAGEVHQNDLFARLMQGGQDVPLHLRQFDIGPVAGRESGHRNVHFLSFQTGRDTARKDHGIKAFQPGEDFFHRIDVVYGLAGFEIVETIDPHLQRIFQGNGGVRNRVVIAPHHLAVVGIRADEGDLAALLEREHAVVFQQHEGLTGHPPVKGSAPGTFHDAFGQFAPKRQAVEFAQPDACFDEPT